MFKHVRGDGKHFLQELNGVKQLVCATSVALASYGSHIRQKLCLHSSLAQMLAVNHTSALSVHIKKVLVLYHMFLFDFPLYRGVVTEYLFRLTEPYYASARS